MKLQHLAAVFLAFGASAAAANVLVVRSTGPSAKNYPAGRSLPDNGRITLQANDMLVVLDGRGTRTLRGPGTFAPGAAAPAATRSVQVASATPQRRARIGAVRGTGIAAAQPRPATLWQVDVAKSSNICLADTRNVTLWRADATKPVTLTVAGPSGVSRQVQWSAGQPTVNWPADLPISAASEYRLSWAGAAAPTRLRFKTLAARPSALEDTATALISNDCQAQLDLLIETVKLPEGAPTAG